MTELERRALLGDKQAQEECTRQGILLPCPFCGGNSEIHEAQAIAEYAKKKEDVPNGARILRKIIYPSGSECFVFRRKTFVPRCCKTSCRGRTSRQYKTIEEALEKWNTRPAPPVGSCGECEKSPDIGTKTKSMRWCRIFRAEVKPDGYCDEFRQKGSEENADD